MLVVARVAGSIAALVLAAIAVLHVAWALGLRAGAVAAVPERDGAPLFRPGPGACLFVAIGLASMALLAVARVGVVTLPIAPALVRGGVFASATVFAARAIGDRRYVGFFKRVTGTRFAELDSKLYSPLCAALAAALFVTAW